MRNPILMIKKYNIKAKMTKTMKGVGFIKRLGRMIPRYSLLTIYKTFVCSHHDYGDVLYDQPNSKSLCQDNAAVVITGVVKGTSQMILYIELGLESLEFRRQCLFFKLKKLVYQNI